MDATNLLVELHLRPLRHPHTPATTTGGAKSDEHYPAKWGQIRGAHPVHSFTILERPFAIETGELTPTLKIKRKAVYQAYAPDFAALYDGGGA